MWPILLLLLLVYVRGEVKNIAVIGSGISGSFVTNTLGNAANAEITIFGPSGCGRVKSDHIQFGGKTVVVEMGASIAYGGNKYIAERAPNLSKKKPYEDNPESTFGIYSVSLSSFKFKQSNIFPPSFPPFLNKVYNKLYLLFTYPQLLFLIPHVNRAASALDSLYVSLSSGTTFSTPSSVWSSLSLSALLTTPWSTFFENEISPFPSRLHSEVKLDEERSDGWIEATANATNRIFAQLITFCSSLRSSQLSAAVNRVNYNAEIDDDLPALVSLVSHVPLVSGDLFNYAEGNDKICQSVRHGTHVDGIVSLVVYDGSIGKFFLYVGSSIGGDQEGYDTVVLSTPWQQREGGLEFKETSHVDGAVLMDLRFDSYGDETEGRYHGFDNEEVNRKEYKSTVTTYVDAKGRIEGGRLGDDGYVPESVFFTDGSWGEDGVFSITLIMEEVRGGEERSNKRRLERSGSSISPTTDH